MLNTDRSQGMHQLFETPYTNILWIRPSQRTTEPEVKLPFSEGISQSNCYPTFNSQCAKYSGYSSFMDNICHYICL